TAAQVVESEDKRFTSDAEFASYAPLGEDGKVAAEATQDFFFASEHFAIEDVVGDDNVTRKTFRIKQSILDGIGTGGGGGGTGPTPLSTSITPDDDVKQTNGVWGFSKPKNSVSFTILEEGGNGEYTRTWSFTGPAGSGAYANGGPDQVHGTSFALLNMIYDGNWQVKCVTTDTTGLSKEAMFDFVVTGNGNGFPTGGSTDFALRMEYRTKTAVGKPD
ncbi:hypothetical protein, partial [Hymenobacter crusticola]